MATETMPQETTYEAGGHIQGLGYAIVTQNKDDKGECRVKVRYVWEEENHESYWARLAMPMAGNGYGVVTIPEVGDEVLVGFDRDDPRHPIVLGAVYNGKDKPPVANNDGKNDKRIFQSRKKHYLLFDDGNRGVVELKHQKGRRIRFDDDGFLVEDERGNQVKVDSNSGAMTIEAKGQLKIKAATISLEATGTLEVKASATLTIKGTTVLIN